MSIWFWQDNNYCLAIGMPCTQSYVANVWAIVVVSHIYVNMNKQLRICPQVEPIRARHVKGMSRFHVGLVTHTCVHAHFHLLLCPSPSYRTFEIDCYQFTNDDVNIRLKCVICIDVLAQCTSIAESAT